MRRRWRRHTSPSDIHPSSRLSISCVGAGLAKPITGAVASTAELQSISLRGQFEGETRQPFIDRRQRSFWLSSSAGMEQIMGQPIMERRVKVPRERIMGRPIIGVERPKNLKASTRASQSIFYIEEDPYDNGTYNDGANEDELYHMQDWSSSTQPPSYDEVHRPEFLWQPYYMEAYENELEIVDELQHLGEFGMKPPYRFGTHEEDPLAREYTKLGPNVLDIASDPTNGQRNGHRFLSQRHANVVLRTSACIYDLRDIVDIDSWCKTAPFPYETMRTARDTFFDESGTLAAHQATNGTPRSKWPVRSFDQLSSTGRNVTRNSTGGSGAPSWRTTCPVKLHV